MATLAEGRKAVACSHPLDPKSTQSQRSERVAGVGLSVRARANPLSLGVWHFTLRFVLPRSWVGYPSRRPKGCGMQSPSGPKVYPKTRGYYHRSSVAVWSSTPRVASHSGMHGVHSRLSISRRRVPGPRAAPASAAVSTHSRGPPYPRAARTLFLTHLLACHVIPFARRFPCRLRSNDPSAWRGVGLLGHEQIRFP